MVLKNQFFELIICITPEITLKLETNAYNWAESDIQIILRNKNLYTYYCF